MGARLLREPVTEDRILSEEEAILSRETGRHRSGVSFCQCNSIQLITSMRLCGGYASRPRGHEATRP